MQVILRTEQQKDFDQVFKLIEQAFRNEEFTDHREQFLVERLRNSAAFIPELSIVAMIGSTIIGHILLTEIKIKDTNHTHKSLALAPVSVLPDYQRKGIGGKLITHAHQVARSMGYASVIVLGHQDYYPRFGYLKAEDFRIQLPFDAPSENCMAKELIQNGLKDISGKVEYPKEFYQ